MKTFYSNILVSGSTEVSFSRPLPIRALPEDSSLLIKTDHVDLFPIPNQDLAAIISQNDRATSDEQVTSQLRLSLLSLTTFDILRHRIALTRQKMNLDLPKRTQRALDKAYTKIDTAIRVARKVIEQDAWKLFRNAEASLIVVRKKAFMTRCEAAKRGRQDLADVYIGIAKHARDGLNTLYAAWGDKQGMTALYGNLSILPNGAAVTLLKAHEVFHRAHITAAHGTPNDLFQAVSACRTIGNNAHQSVMDHTRTQRTTLLDVYTTLRTHSRETVAALYDDWGDAHGLTELYGPLSPLHWDTQAAIIKHHHNIEEAQRLASDGTQSGFDRAVRICKETRTMAAGETFKHGERQELQDIYKRMSAYITEVLTEIYNSWSDSHGMDELGVNLADLPRETQDALVKNYRMFRQAERLAAKGTPSDLGRAVELYEDVHRRATTSRDWHHRNGQTALLAIYDKLIALSVTALTKHADTWADLNGLTEKYGRLSELPVSVIMYIIESHGQMHHAEKLAALGSFQGIHQASRMYEKVRGQTHHVRRGNRRQNRFGFEHIFQDIIGRTDDGFEQLYYARERWAVTGDPPYRPKPGSAVSFIGDKVLAKVPPELSDYLKTIDAAIKSADRTLTLGQFSEARTGFLVVRKKLDTLMILLLRYRERKALGHSKIAFVRNINEFVSMVRTWMESFVDMINDVPSTS